MSSRARESDIGRTKYGENIRKEECAAFKLYIWKARKKCCNKNNNVLVVDVVDTLFLFFVLVVGKKGTFV